MWLTDASDDALDVARANLAGLGRRAANVRIAGGHWFDALPAGTSLDLVVSNPPYVASGSADVAAVGRGVGAPRGAVRRSRRTRRHPRDRRRRTRVAATGGWLVLEIGADQGDAVERLLVGRGYTDVAIRPDLAGRDRVAVARVPH